MDFFERLTSIRRSIGAMALLAFVSFVFFVMLLALSSPWMLLPVVLTALFLTLAGVRVAAYRRYYKSNLVRALLEDTFEETEYNADMGIPPEDIESSGLLTVGNHYRFGDFVSGKYKGISFRQSDAILGERRGKNLYTHFSGRFMIFEFDTPFDFELLIKEKSFASPQRPVGQGKILEPVYLDDESFHRFFSVHTDNRKRAEYILTPAFREAILRMNYEIMGDFLIAFKPDAIYVALNGVRDSFEPPMAKLLNRETLRKEVFRDIRVITLFLDSLLSSGLYRGESHDET